LTSLVTGFKVSALLIEARNGISEYAIFKLSYTSERDKGADRADQPRSNIIVWEKVIWDTAVA